MVKKLYKYEFKAWLRVIPFFWIAMLAIAAAARIIQFFEPDELSVYYTIIFGSSMLACSLAALVVFATNTVFGVYRFYRNLFSGEGYLSFTLPVTVGQHLWVKLSTLVCFEFAAGLVVLLAGAILTSGEVLVEICKAAAYLIQKIPELPGKTEYHLLGYIAELMVTFIGSFFLSALMYYSCVCIGQLFRKVRILAAVGVYFAYQTIMQVVSTGLYLAFMALVISGAMEKVFEFIEKHPFATAHGFFIGICLLVWLAAGVFWVVCKRILSKRLNLE